MSAVESIARSHSPAVAASAIIDRDRLSRALDMVKRAVEKRTTIPILANVRIVSEHPGLVSITGTDLDIWTTVRVDASVDLGFDATVPAHQFADLLKKAKGARSILLDVKPDGENGEHRVVVDIDGFRTSLSGLPVGDFPQVTHGEFTHRIRDTSPAFAKLFRKVAGCISNEETRYYLNGVYLHTVSRPDGDTLTAVATDGHRLARFTTPAGLPAKGMPGIIIPAKTVGQFIKIMGAKGAAATSTLEVSETRCRLTCGDVVMTSKLVDGTFPDYPRVIPQNNSHVMRVMRSEFADAVRQVASISSERGRAVKVTPESDHVRLTVVNPDLGSSVLDFQAAHNVSGEPGPEFGMNAGYLTAALENFDSETVTIATLDHWSPILFTSSGDPDLLMVVMPMRA
jgi:DNA polymerase-3 subunit beta